MKRTNEAAAMINTLETGNFYAVCPCCEEPLRLKEAGLFYLDDFTPEGRERYDQMWTDLKLRAKDLKARRVSITKKSEVGAQAVNIGFILERLAPSMRAFPFERNDCRSLFDPIDYVIFEGLSRKRSISKILFADIKTGNARLNKTQKEIKGIVEKKRVDWDTYKSGGRP